MSDVGPVKHANPNSNYFCQNTLTLGIAIFLISTVMGGLAASQMWIFQSMQIPHSAAWIGGSAAIVIALSCIKYSNRSSANQKASSSSAPAGAGSSDTPDASATAPITVTAPAPAIVTPSATPNPNGTEPPITTPPVSASSPASEAQAATAATTPASAAVPADSGNSSSSIQRPAVTFVVEPGSPQERRKFRVPPTPMRPRSPTLDERNEARKKIALLLSQGPSKDYYIKCKKIFRETVPKELSENNNRIDAYLKENVLENGEKVNSLFVCDCWTLNLKDMPIEEGLDTLNKMNVSRFNPEERAAHARLTYYAFNAIKTLLENISGHVPTTVLHADAALQNLEEEKELVPSKKSKTRNVSFALPNFDKPSPTMAEELFFGRLSPKYPRVTSEKELLSKYRSDLLKLDCEKLNITIVKDPQVMQNQLRLNDQSTLDPEKQEAYSCLNYFLSKCKKKAPSTAE